MCLDKEILGVNNTGCGEVKASVTDLRALSKRRQIMLALYDCQVATRRDGESLHNSHVLTDQQPVFTKHGHRGRRRVVTLMFIVRGLELHV